MATQQRKAVAEGLRLTSRIEAHDEEASQGDITNAREIIALVTASVNPHVFKTSKTIPEATSAELKKGKSAQTQHRSNLLGWKTVPVLIRQKHVVGSDGDELGVTDFHLVVKLDQTLGLTLILWAVASPAEHNDHGIRPL